MNTCETLLAGATLALTMIPTAPAAETGYAPVNGLRLYYETHGPANATQPPLVLLHGGGDTIETSFSHLLPELARTRRVIAFEQQGYGRTADIPERPFSFTQSADDTAGLLAHLGIARADLLGYSNGGTIALEVAMRHPQLVRKLVLVSALAGRRGTDPAFWDFMRHARLENMPVELQEAYRKVAPQPENLRLMHDKAAQRMRDFTDLPLDRLRAITAPTLVMVGDRDVIRPEHAVELLRLLPHAQLAILPGTDHMDVVRRPAWVVPMVTEFLDGTRLVAESTAPRAPTTPHSAARKSKGPRDPVCGT